MAMQTPPGLGFEDPSGVGVPYLGRQATMESAWSTAVTPSVPYFESQGSNHAIGILGYPVGNTHRSTILQSTFPHAAGSHAKAFSLNGGAQAYEHQPQLFNQAHALWLRREQGHALGKDLARLQFAEMSQRCREAVGDAPSQKLHESSIGAGIGYAIAQDLLEPRRVLPIQQQTRQQSIAIDATQVAACSSPIGKKRTHKPVEKQAQTLSTSLQLLSNEDPDCLFIVRRINKLGFKAARKLKQHFLVYGTVVRVLVAHSTVRQQGDEQSIARRRPSSLGFVHMASAGAVKLILAAGVEQDVDGCLIRVQRFERQIQDGMEQFQEE